MRKGMIALLCVAGMMLWGVSAANAVVLNWTLLTDATIAGTSPVDQSGYWVVPPGSAGTNGCNFATTTNCATGGVPGIGSYSFSAIEYDNALPYSCLDIAGGATAGAPCVCAEGGTCTSDADCTASSCAGAGDCCPGALNTCKPCVDNPSGPDSFSFFGVDPALGPAPNMDTCQTAGGNNFKTTKYHVASSESISGSGGACLKLNPTNGPFLGTFTSTCGVGAISDGLLDVDVYVGGCVLKGTTINNIAYVGRVYDTAVAAPAGTCGYTVPQINTMLGQASAKSGDYMMVLCGSTIVPTTSKTACLRGAEVDFVVVAYTDDDASDCTTTCP